MSSKMQAGDSDQKSGPVASSVELEEMMEKVWAVADRDGSGDVSSSELKSMVEKLTGRPVSALALQALMEKIDADGDGTINKKEFFSSVQGFVLAGTAASPRRRGAKRSASGGADDDPTGEVVSRRRVLDDIRAMFDLSDASLDAEGRMRLAMAAASDGEESSALNSFERQIKAEEEAKARAENLKRLENFVSDANKPIRDKVSAAISGKDPAGKLKGMNHVCHVIEAASDWSRHTKDRRVQKLVMAAFEYVKDAGVPNHAARILAYASSDMSRLGEVTLVNAVLASLRVLRMYAQGPGFLNLPPTSTWHVSNAWKETRVPMLRSRITRSGETLVHVAVRLGTTCGKHSVRLGCIQLLSALASFAGDEAPDFRIFLTENHAIAKVCCQRLSDVDHPEPSVNREAISKCLAIMCGHGHGSPPHALDRLAYDKMGGLLLTVTVLKRLQLDKLDTRSPEQLVSTYGHLTNLCDAFCHLLPCSKTDPGAWGFLLERARPRHLHSEHEQSRLAATRFVRSILQLIALLLTNNSDKLLRMILKPSPFLSNGLIQDAIIPVLQDPDVSTEVKLKALQCLTSLSTRKTSTIELDPRAAIGSHTRLLGLLVDFVKKDPQLRVRSVVIIEKLALHAPTCRKLIAGGVLETMSQSLEQYRRQDEDVKEAIGIASYVYNTTLAKHSLIAMEYFVRSITKERVDGGGRPSPQLKHFMKPELVDRANAVLQIIIDESRRRRRMFEEGKVVEAHIGQFLVALRDEMLACHQAGVEDARDIGMRADAAIRRYGETRAKLREAMDKEQALKISSTMDADLRAYSGTASTGVVAECVVSAADDARNTRFFQLDSRTSFERVRAYIEHLYEYRVVDAAGVFDMASSSSGAGAAKGGAGSVATTGRSHLQIAYSLKGSINPDRAVRNDDELKAAIDYFRTEMLPELRLIVRCPEGRPLKKLPDLRNRGAADEIASMMRSNYGDRGLPNTDQIRKVVSYFQRHKIEQLNKTAFTQFLHDFNIEGAKNFQQTKALFRAIDKDCSGSISVPEILAWAATKQKGTRKDKIRMAFRAYDADHSGTIGEDELMKILLTQGDHSKDSAARAADQIMRAFDHDGNRQLDLDEFEMAAMSYPELAKLFVGEDRVVQAYDGVGYGYDSDDADEDEDDEDWKEAGQVHRQLHSQGRGKGRGRRDDDWDDRGDWDDRARDGGGKRKGKKGKGGYFDCHVCHRPFETHEQLQAHLRDTGHNKPKQARGRGDGGRGGRGRGGGKGGKGKGRGRDNRGGGRGRGGNGGGGGRADSLF